MKTKIYQRTNLLDDNKTIIARCNLIERVSKLVSFIPNTQIIINEESITYQQNFLRRKNFHHLTTNQKLKLLKEFAENLDSLQPFGFVHGDINSTNVLYDANKLNLIDLEPSFKQLKYGKKVVMSAVPLRSLHDIQHKTITVETDKIGFYLVCKRFMSQSLNLPKKNQLKQKRKEGFEFLPIKESNFVALSFIQIFKNFIDKKTNEKN